MSSSSDKAKPKILLVDDENEILELMSDSFQRNGFPVETAKSGVEAVEKLSQEAFDVAIVDLHMPQMGGLGLCNWVQNNQPNLKVIICTAFESDLDESIPYPVVLKPVSIGALLNVLSHTLDFDQSGEGSKAS